MSERLEDACALAAAIGSEQGAGEPAPGVVSPPRNGGAALRPVVFSTETLPVRAQFDAWYDRCAPLIEVGRPGVSSRAFRANNELWDLQGMLMSTVNAPASHFMRSQRNISRDGIDHWVLGCSVRGGMCVSKGEQRRQIAQGEPFVLTMDQPFEGEREDSQWVTLFLPRDGFADLAPLLDAAAGTTADTPLSGLLADYIVSLASRVPHLGAADLPPLAGATRAMIAACLAPLRDAVMSDPMREHVMSERIRRAVNANLGAATLGPSRLCRMLGVSRSQLYRAMERHGGVARYIQRLRLVAAHKALSNPEDVRPIQAVAETVGFADASTFGRAFRQVFGATPGEVRAAARVGSPLAMVRFEPDFAVGTGFTELLRRL